MSDFGAVKESDWEKGSLRVEIASKIVGYIFNQPNEMVGPATLATRERGLRYADEIIALVEPVATRKGIVSAAEKIGNMRQSEAGLFDAKHSGQRGVDRSDALYDAYQAVMALASEGGR